MLTWYKKTPKGFLLNLLIKPNSKSNKFLEKQDIYLKIQIKAPAIENKANLELIDFLAHEFKLPKKAFIIEKGFKSKYKQILVTDAENLESKLNELNNSLDEQTKLF